MIPELVVRPLPSLMQTFAVPAPICCNV